MENLSEADAKRMHAERFNSDSKLVAGGAEISAGQDNSMNITPTESQKMKMHREFERSQGVYEALRSPELMQNMDKLETMAQDLENDFNDAIESMDENDGRPDKYSKELRDFIVELKNLLGADGNVGYNPKLGGTYANEWLLEGSRLANSINYTSPHQNEGTAEYVNHAVKAMILDRTNPAQVVSIMKNKMKAALWDAAKDTGKIIV